MDLVTCRRAFSMPTADTFSMRPVEAFLRPYLVGVSVDPFARSSRLATYTNDLNPDTDADWHMDAVAFCDMLISRGVVADVVLVDPPYSPRQISEVYKGIGRKATGEDTQNARLYKAVRDGLDKLLRPGGVALSFGWNSAGMGKTRGYDLIEVALVAHGGAHNDTICVAERKSLPDPEDGK